ncbi:MAG TPA: 50S ribosomal protein L10 [Oceanithermus sp.]|nr:50S ribosomal protein L10 [Oceanithermus sp.]
MPNPRNVRLLGEIKSALEATGGSFFLVNYQGLTAAEDYELRRRLREERARLFVAKNTLIRIAMEELGQSSIEEHLKGPSALVFFEDPVAAAKVLVQFAEEVGKEIPKVKAGLLSGQVLTASEVESLAKMKSLDELRAELVGVMSAPLMELVGVLGGAQRELVGLLEAKVQKEAA